MKTKLFPETEVTDSQQIDEVSLPQNLSLQEVINIHYSGDVEAAKEGYQYYVDQNVDDPAPYSNLAAIYINEKRYQEAVSLLNKSLEIAPDYVYSHLNLSNILMEYGRFNEASQGFITAYNLNNSLKGALCNHWTMRMHMCDWSEYQEMQSSLRKASWEQVIDNRASDISNEIHPFSMMSICDDPGLLLKLSKDYALSKTASLTSVEPLFRQQHKRPGDPVKIAFVSGDLRAHPVGYLIAELFELIDQDQFETHAISLSHPRDDSLIRQRIKSACHHFHEVSAKSDIEIARLIAHLGIDIAVDCHGHTKASRPSIFAYRPAPIQINQLGYPGTMGADYIDYMFADPFIIPEEMQDYYSEKIAYLPDTSQLNDRQRKVSPQQPSRKDCGLPDNGFVFCCHNNSLKFTPDIFKVWMEILKETPGSVIWLYGNNPWARKNLFTEAEAHGIEPWRIIFADKVPYDEHLARINNADLFLDTNIYNSHSTANDALWMGLPLITCTGKGIAARVAGNNLLAAGMQELITYDLDSYKALALELAHSPEKLAKIKNKLVNNRDVCALFDTERLIKNMELAYQHMADLNRSGEAPETFYVDRKASEKVSLSNPNKATEPQIKFKESFGESIGKEDFTLQDIVDIHLNGQNELAAKGYQEFVDLKVSNSIPYSNLASIYIEENKFYDAIPLLKKAIRIEPADVDAHVKLATSLEVVTDRKSKESIGLLKKAISLEPTYATAHLILGGVYMERELAEEAISSFRKAISLNPEFALAHYNLGTLFMKLERLQESAQSFLNAFTKDPVLTDAISKYWSMQLKMCNWSEFHDIQKTLLSVAQNQDTKIAAIDVTRAITPLSLLSITDEPALHLQTSHDYSLAVTQLVHTKKVLFKNRKIETGSQIKIAFVSGDMRQHALGYLIAELFELMNKDQFEIYAISLSTPDNHCEITKRIQSACGHFIDVSTKTDKEIAQLIADLNIDIAVDCHGFTADCRPAIFAYRPAPVQVNHMGYPGTLGAEYIDYIVATPFLIPEEQQAHYSEKIAYIPGSCHLSDRHRQIATQQPTRKECGLPEEAFVFCCFNNTHKIMPDLFSVWMEILQETPDSVLWLFESNAWVKENLQAEAKARDIDPSRLIFAEKLPYDQHLARTKNADLFLDTLPYNAHSTCNDALWMGLPVITCAGNSLAARVAGSHLKAVELDELITYDLDAYKLLALDLAHCPERLAQIKQKLISTRESCHLFDIETLVKNFERAYQNMADIYRAGKKPATFYLEKLEKNTFQISNSVSINETHLHQQILQDALNAHTSGDLLAAHKSYQQLIDADVTDPLPYANIADIYIQENNYESALPLLQKIITIDPDHLAAHMKLSVVLEILSNGKSDETIDHLHKVIKIKPDNAMSHFLLGNALGKRGNVELAINSFTNAIEHEPDLALAHYNLGLLLQKQNKLNDAAASLHKAIVIDKTLKDAITKYWNLRRKMCDWSDYASMLDSMQEAIDGQLSDTETPNVASCISPYTILSLLDQPALHLQLSKDYALAKTSLVNPVSRFFTQRNKTVGELVKIAFVSGDMRQHALGYLIAELFELMNKDQFEIYAISLSTPDNHCEITKRIQSACGHFIDVSTKTDKEIAQLIADLNIDIAVDCHGFTADCRPAIFAYRPAPVQVNHMGYPGTLGAEYIDYIVATPFLIPEEQQAHYSEKIAYIPGSCHLSDRHRQIATQQPTRKECGLPEEAFVFCCFNNTHKIMPDLFSVWMEILQETPDSVLWLFESNAWVKENLQAEAKARDIDPSRLIFAEKLPYDQHLARTKNADLFLDTLPYNAHSTCNDALWMGLPVITCAGNSLAARVAGSHLKAVELDELITYDLDAYKLLALDLAHCPERLAQIKQKLISTRESCHLFDIETLVKNFERAYQNMADIYRAGKKPETFYLEKLKEEHSMTKSPSRTDQPVENIAKDIPNNIIEQTAYTACPICESQSIEMYLEIESGQIDQGQQKPARSEITWMTCMDCQHSFRSSYSPDKILDSHNHGDQTSQDFIKAFETGRSKSAHLIEKVFPYCSTGTWINVGINDGSLLTSAYEYGYNPVCIDESEQRAAALSAIGVEAYCGNLENHEGQADVISMVNSLQCMPYPLAALKAAYKILNKEGVLLLSMPNATSPLWHALSKEGQNPYWEHPDHLHNFGRELVYEILKMTGFKVRNFSISNNQRIGMNIVATKGSD